MNIQATVIPLVTCANSIGMKYMLDGMEDCSVVAFNSKGPLGNKHQLPIFIDSIRYCVDNLPKLKSIIVYTTSPNIEKVQELFQYAIDAGISIQIPDNILRQRHKLLGGTYYGSH